jgi:ankyrin repeat protein
MTDDELSDLLDELNAAIENARAPRPEDSDTIYRLIRDHPELIRTMDDLGHYPLHNAAYYDHFSAVTWLIENGADVNALTDTGDTPLHLAAYNGQVNACVLLARAGADLTRRTAEGLTPLLNAISRQQDAAVGALLRVGAPMDFRAAVNLRQTAIVRTMLRDNPGLLHEEPDATDIVAEAASAGDLDVLTMLLEAGANPNTARVNYRSLINAMSGNDRPVVELLLRHGADPDREVRLGSGTPRQYAEQSGETLGWALELFSRPRPTE